jgi:hypothetical protein
MQTNDESVWLFKINPKVLGVLNQLLKAIALGQNQYFRSQYNGLLTPGALRRPSWDS